MENTTDQLPSYGLKKLEIRGYKGIQHAQVDGLSKGAPWIFLTGLNGHGKTCVLQAIYLALAGAVDGQTILVTDRNFYLEAEVEIAGGATKQFITKSRDEYSQGTREIPLVAYGPSRLSVQGSLSANKEKEQSSNSYSLFNSNGILLNIETELLSLLTRGRTLVQSDAINGDSSLQDTGSKLIGQYNAIIKVLMKLVPNIASITVDKNYQNIQYIEVGDPKPKFFDELASGYKSIIAMVGDMMIRLFNKQTSNTIPAALEGIVLIDELDLHLHVSWQKKLPGLLSEVFPKIQFIATTHSAIPILGAPKGSLFLTVDRTEDEGIIIEKLDIDVANLTPNLILSSEIFGFQDIVASSNKDLGQLRTEDTIEEMNYHDVLKERLRQFSEDGGTYPKDLFKK